MRRALLVGIDDYPQAPLSGCVADAQRLRDILARNEDGSPNFDCRTVLAPRGQALGRSQLRETLHEHFAGEVDIALLHFSGHGFINELGGYLVTSDARSYDEGIAMRDVIMMANRSSIEEVVILLDCCHSGALGEPASAPADHVTLREGVALLTASGRGQVAMEANGAGIFSSLVCSALAGQAADVFGHVTVAGIYAHLDPYLGAWQQRPRLRANLRRLTPLRQCKPPVDFEVLRKLPAYFSTESAQLALDPSYEPTSAQSRTENVAVFSDLQLLSRRHMVEPVSHAHMYDAAMKSGACRLTRQGKHCWQLAAAGRL